MHFTVPPEMFTSITDLIDAIAAVAFLIVLRRDKSTVARLLEGRNAFACHRRYYGLYGASARMGQSNRGCYMGNSSPADVHSLLYVFGGFRSGCFSAKNQTDANIFLLAVRTFLCGAYRTVFCGEEISCDIYFLRRGMCAFLRRDVRIFFCKDKTKKLYALSSRHTCGSAGGNRSGKAQSLLYFYMENGFQHCVSPHTSDNNNPFHGRIFAQQERKIGGKQINIEVKRAKMKILLDKPFSL